MQSEQGFKRCVRCGGDFYPEDLDADRHCEICARDYEAEMASD